MGEKFRFGCDPVTTDYRELEFDQFVFGGAFAALSRNMPPLLAGLKSPQVLLGMLFNAYVLVNYWAGRLTLADIVVFYFFEVGVYLALYVPKIFFHIAGDGRKTWREKKENFEALFYWTFSAVFYPLVIVYAYTSPMTGYREQLVIVLAKLKLGLVVFALQFCLGAFHFLTRPGHRYSYQATAYPFRWYVAGQITILPLLFFVALPLWFLTGSYVPGVTFFLLMRINNEVGPQLAALKLEEDISWNLQRDAMLKARKGR